jgi:hypothetical protein
MFSPFIGTRPKLAGSFYFIFALCLPILGCNLDGTTPSDPTTIPLPIALVGKWQSTWNEEYEISKTEFISSYGGTVSYKGNIVHVRDDVIGGGYITIRYTGNAIYPSAVGKYYVIHWQGLTTTGVTLSGANDGNGKSTLADAEYEYTVANGSFAFGSDCARAP